MKRILFQSYIFDENKHNASYDPYEVFEFFSCKYVKLLEMV